MKHSFEHCALRYLLLWETEERELHAAMKDRPSPVALRASMQHFRIARSFKGIAEKRNAILILHALDRIAGNRGSSPCDDVKALAAEFRKQFDKFNVSAASKLLWLKFRSPYIICDRRALKGLKILRPNFKNSDYADYYATWKSTYAEHEPDVARAAQQLPKLQPFFGAWHKSYASLAALSNQRWFRERVFDNYLWRLGDGQQVVGPERR